MRIEFKKFKGGKESQLEAYQQNDSQNTHADPKAIHSYLAKPP